MAIATAAKQVIVDGMDVVVAGGQENISAVQNDYGKWIAATMDPNVVARAEHAYMPMLMTAEHVARRYGISRESQDAYSAESQRRTALAQREGRFDAEIVPVSTTMAVADKVTGELSYRDLMGRFLRFFPSVVTGSVLLVIGISLMKVGIDWSAGGQALLPDGSVNANYGRPLYLGISLGVLVLILLLSRFAKGFLGNIAVLLGVVAGFCAAWLAGEVSLDELGATSWVALIRPFAFGMPVFDPLAIVSMCLVMLVTMVESTGMFLALGQIVNKPTTPERLVRGLRADGLGALLGGVFNAFPYTSFSQNIGLVTMTGIKTRFVCVAGGLILIALGLFPKMAYIVAATPSFVLGAAALVMFGMVAVMGIRILATVDYESHRGNALLAAISVGVGVIPLLSPTFFSHLPAWREGERAKVGAMQPS
jgi:uric acid transporter